MHWLVALVLAVSMGAGFAQTTDGPEFESTPANLDCLLPAAADRGSPVYPDEERVSERSATVTANLTFQSATQPPKIEFAGAKRNPAFEKSVADYVTRYRLPCFIDGQAPILVEQTFKFSYSDNRPVVYNNVGGKVRRAHWTCVERTTPKYPTSDRHVMGEGNVVLDIIFSEKNAEPKIHVIYGARNRSLEAAAARAARGYRYTCDIPAGEPLVAQQRFHFRLEGGKSFAIRDMDLMAFLGSVEREGLGKVRFDFNEMGCPFDLKVALYRPYARNILGEFLQSNPKRKPFMDWLSQLTMRFPGESEPYLIGQPFKVSVPCTILDLT